MIVFLLSLVGIPPLGGFVGKFMLFADAIDAHFTWLAVVGIVNSVLSLAVYLRIIEPMYRHQGKIVAAQRLVWTSPIAIVVLVTLAATIAIGLAAQPLLAWLG